MKREIKFRAWVDNRMVYLPIVGLQYFDFEGSYVLPFVVDGYKEYWAHENYTYGDISERMNKAVIMQFTGLFDKNGKEIYEGDVVKVEPFIPDGIIVWNEDIAAFQYAYKAHGKGAVIDGRMTNTLYKHETDKYEVIGNIYENPDLLTHPTSDKN